MSSFNNPKGCNLLVDSFLQHTTEGGKPVEPVDCLENDLKCWFNEVLVSCAASGDCRLVREGAGRFQSALNGHQPELLRKLVGIDCAESQLPALFQKKQTVRAQLRQRRRTRLPIEKKRNQIVT